MFQCLYNLTDLKHLITFFILILLYTVSKSGISKQKMLEHHTSTYIERIYQESQFWVLSLSYKLNFQICWLPPTTARKILPSYVQDTTDFVKKLETIKDKSEDFILVTLDVRGLYTSISNHEGIETVKETLNNYTS